MMAAAPPAGSSADWRDVDPNNLVLIDTRYGEIAVELAPDFAPRHVARVRALIRAHFYDGQSFYRVIDGFVAQGGMGEGTAATKAQTTGAVAKAWPRLKAEFDAPVSHGFTPLGSPDLFAPEVGHVERISRRARPRKRMWIIHCPGTFAFARDNDNDTATTEFYIVIGQGPAGSTASDGLRPRHRRPAISAEAEPRQSRDRQRRHPGPEAARPDIRVRAGRRPAGEGPAPFSGDAHDSAAFAAKKDAKLNPAPDFYHRKPPQGPRDLLHAGAGAPASLEARPRGGRRLPPPAIKAMCPALLSGPLPHAPLRFLPGRHQYRLRQCALFRVRDGRAPAADLDRLDLLHGFNLGIDFTGGVELEVKSAHAIDVGTMRSEVDSLRFNETELQNIGNGDCDMPVSSCVLIRSSRSDSQPAGCRCRDQDQAGIRLYFAQRECGRPQSQRELLHDGVEPRSSRLC